MLGIGKKNQDKFVGAGLGISVATFPVSYVQNPPFPFYAATRLRILSERKLLSADDWKFSATLGTFCW